MSHAVSPAASRCTCTPRCPPRWASKRCSGSLRFRRSRADRSTSSPTISSVRHPSSVCGTKCLCVGKTARQRVLPFAASRPLYEMPATHDGEGPIGADSKRSLDRTFPPHTFSVLHPVGHLPRSPVCLRPARPRAPVLTPCTSQCVGLLRDHGKVRLFSSGIGAISLASSTRAKAKPRRGRGKRVAGRRTSARSSGPRGGEESVGDVLRGVGRKKCVAGSTCQYTVLAARCRKQCWESSTSRSLSICFSPC